MSRAYRALLRLYPRDFRRRYGAEMEESFRERRAEGGVAVWLWIRTIADALVNGLALRLGPGPTEKGVDMDFMRQDIRFAFRSLRRRPGFALVAVATLALGVGANSAIFTIVNALLLRPLPLPEADRLVLARVRTEKLPRLAAAYPEYRDWKAQSQSFTDMGAWRGQSVNLTQSGEPERLVGAFVTASFFTTLGVMPVLGRNFLPEETEPETARAVAILSHDLFRTRFGGDRSILGRSLILNGKPHVVVGVMGPEFSAERAPAGSYILDTDVWLAAPSFPNARGLERGQGEFGVIGRLKPGTDVAQAGADLAVVARRLEAAYPETQAGRQVVVAPLHDEMVSQARPAALILFGAVALVLLIACANVANLLLARGAQRGREMAVRAAVGAGRRRLFGQLVTESVILAVIGGALGLGLGVLATPILGKLLPRNTLPPEILTVDRIVIIYTFAVTALSALIFGVVPALRVSRADLHGELKASSSGGGTRQGLRDALVVAEGAISLVLLVCAGLLLRSALAVAEVDPGFDPRNVLKLSLRLPPSKYPTPEAIGAFFRDVEARLQALPGVESAALVRAAPFGGNDATVTYEIEGRPPAPVGREPTTNFNIVSPDYFRTLRLPLLAGRAIAAADTRETIRVAVVSEALARTEYPDGNAIGKRIKVGGEKDWFTIVGIAANGAHGDLTVGPRRQVYTAMAQLPKIFTEVLVRTATDPMAMVPTVRAAIWSVDSDQPMWAIASMETLVDRARASSRTLGLLLGVFAGLAVALAAIGVYGVMSFAVSQRTREIGIRVALGASSHRVVGEVLRRGLRLATIAAGVGALLAFGLGRFLASELYGVGPADPISFLAGVAVLFAASVLASWLPARRAARVDPMVALRED